MGRDEYSPRRNHSVLWISSLEMQLFFFSFFSFSIPLFPVAVLDTNAFQAEMLFGVESQILTVMERTQPPKKLFLKAKKFVVLDRVMERKLVILELVDLAEVGAGR